MTAVAAEMRTEGRATCGLCQSPGVIQHEALEDRVCGVPGRWNIRKCQNAACGAAWGDPRPIEADILKAYANYYTHAAEPNAGQPDGVTARLKRAMTNGYLANQHGYTQGVSRGARALGVLMYLFPWQRAYVDFSVFHLPARAVGRLLEIGCGRGDTLVRLRELGWDVEGVDLDPVPLKFAEARGIKVRVGVVRREDYPRDHYDAVTMSHVIEHVYDPGTLLEAMQAMLKPGGRAVVVTPNLASLGHRWFGRDWRGLEPPRHIQIFTASALQALAMAAGFRHARVFTDIGHAPAYFAASAMVRRNTYAHVAKGTIPRSVRLVALGFALCEWVALKFRPGVGEELILIAEK